MWNGKRIQIKTKKFKKNFKPKNYTYHLFIAARLITIKMVTQSKSSFITTPSSVGQKLRLGLSPEECSWVTRPQPQEWKALESVHTHSLGLAVDAGCQLGTVSQTEHAHKAWASSEHGGWILKARVPKERARQKS